MTRPGLLVVAMSLLPAAWSVHAGGFLPIVLHRRRQLVYAGEERRDLPHVSLGERLVPGGHAGTADAGANHVEEAPFRIIGWVKNEVRSRVRRGCTNCRDAPGAGFQRTGSAITCDAVRAERRGFAGGITDCGAGAGGGAYL